MAASTDFNVARDDIVNCLESALEEKDDDSTMVLGKTFQRIPMSKSDIKRQVMDQAFKDVLRRTIVKDNRDSRENDTTNYIAIINMSINAVKQEMCTNSLPFMLLSDLFDSITLDKCDEVFHYVENNVSQWKSWEAFYNSGKNYLLRMCNDLLRRLSKSHNTIFCGRIQLFLARLFPLSEKSGLNLMSQFNLENVTVYTTKSEDYDKARKMSVEAEKDEDMDIEEGETDDSASSIPIDYNLYRKFWAIQDYFRKPTQCYDKAAWKTFSNYSEEVLQCFENFKLDDVKSVKKGSLIEPHSCFAKYLTSEKLLDLQLSDCNFRRYVLVQFLILFQYLNAEVKFKNANQVLSEEQQTWVKQCNDRVLKILKETPPDGEEFTEEIIHILRREENWNTWKNESCQSYVRVASEEEKNSLIPKGPKKRSLGEDIKASGSKLLKMGNPELTRLWNLNPDNLGACREPKRDFLPSLDAFFEDAMEQIDPEQQCDEEYWYIKNASYSWKALRLLARRSPHFFAQQTGGANSQSRTLPKYLENILTKMNKEKNSSNTSETEQKKSADDEPESAAAEPDADQDDSALDATEDSPKEDEPDAVTQDHVEQLANALKGEWNKLATELNFPDDEITFIANDSDDVIAQGVKFLSIWLERDGDRATIPALRIALKEIGQMAACEQVFGEEEN